MLEDVFLVTLLRNQLQSQRTKNRCHFSTSPFVSTTQLRSINFDYVSRAVEAAGYQLAICQIMMFSHSHVIRRLASVKIAQNNAHVVDYRVTAECQMWIARIAAPTRNGFDLLFLFLFLFRRFSTKFPCLLIVSTFSLDRYARVKTAFSIPTTIQCNILPYSRLEMRLSIRTSKIQMSKLWTLTHRHTSSLVFLLSRDR